jgi:integrase
VLPGTKRTASRPPWYLLQLVRIEDGANCDDHALRAWVRTREPDRPRDLTEAVYEFEDQCDVGRRVLGSNRWINALHPASVAQVEASSSWRPSTPTRSPPRIATPTSWLPSREPRRTPPAAGFGASLAIRGLDRRVVPGGVSIWASTRRNCPSSSGNYFDLHNFRNRNWKLAQKAAGITPRRRVYDLRHTFATFALRAGISTFDLSRYMGISLAMIDRHYGHLARDGREHAIRLLDTYRTAETETLDVHAVDAAWTPSTAHYAKGDNRKGPLSRRIVESL